MIVMNETVKLLLSLSLSGSILAVLIFAVKPFLKHKLSKAIQYYIWIVVLLRIVIPFSFENSIMNDVFYSNRIPLEISNQRTVQPIDGTRKNTINSSISPNVQENIANEVYKDDIDHGRYFRDLYNQYVLYIWLFGVIIALTVNLVGYIRFLQYLKRGNRLATDEENRMLTNLLNGGKHVRLIRNRFVSTPMIIGILRPSIIIPDVDFNEKQLKNILLHEISHLRRFDIGVKWLTMIATSIHWFNPLMYFIKKEINHACELACDETVIKNLSDAEKQAYGDTLIFVVAEHKYPSGVLQATMCEEKKSLKERLVAIMNHNKKSRLIMIFSGIMLGFVIFGALYLGAGVGSGKNTPPNIYISAEGEKTKVALMGSYSWKNGGEHIQADSDHPINFEYKLDNVVLATGKEQLIIGTQKLKRDKQYDFTIEEIEVYKDDQLIEFETVEPSFMNGDLYIQAPLDAGEYIYTLRLNFKDRGIVSYGFVVRVDILTSTQEISAEERQRMDLYIVVMKAAFQVENGGNGFVAVQLDTLEGLSDQAKEEVLNELTSLSPNVYSFENVKNDNTKFELDDDGRLIRSLDGTLLGVEVEKYSKSKATITGVSWFGNLGAVFPKYQATFENGVWQRKLISMSIS